MSKQLAISATFATFAMAAFALFASPLADVDGKTAQPHASVIAIAATDEAPAFSNS